LDPNHLFASIRATQLKQPVVLELPGEATDPSATSIG
jgi:hypothetical protein